MTNKKMIISACSIALSGVILLNAQTAHASDTNVTSESIQTTNSLSNSSTGTSSDAQSTTASNDNTTETASQNTQTSNETNAAGKTVEDIFKQTLDYNDSFIDYNNIKEINQTINYKDRTTGEEIAPSNNQTSFLVPWYDTRKVTLKYIVDDSSKNKNNPNAGQVIQTYDIYQGAGSTLQFDFAAVAKSFQDAVSTTPGIEGANHWHVQDTSHLATYKIDGNIYSDISFTIKVTPDTYDDGNSTTYANLPTSMYKTEKIVNLDNAKKYYARVDGDNILREVRLSGNDINFYFNEVKSPYIKNYKLEDPNQLIIPANSQSLADGQSQIIDVYYQPVSTSSIVEEALPDTMVDFNSIKEVTQTINYKDKTTGKELASANIQTQSLVPYYQTSTVTIEIRSVDFTKIASGVGNINNLYEYAENYPLKDKVIQTYHITQPVGSTLQFDEQALGQELQSTSIHWSDPEIGGITYHWQLNSSFSDDIGNVKFTDSNQTVRLYISPNVYSTVGPDPEGGKYADGFLYYPEVPNSLYKTENITNHVFAGGTPSYAIVKDNQIIKSGITNPADTNFEFEAVASPNIKNYQLVDTNQHTIPETSENAANAASRTIDVLYTQSGQSDTGTPLTDEVKPVANIINFVDPDGNPVKDPDGNPVTKKVSGNPGDPITLDLPKGFHFPNGKTPDISIDPDKPVVNIPVIKDLTDTGDPLTEQVKPVANIINFVDPDGNPVKDPDGNPVTKRVSGNPGDPISLDLPKGFHFPNGKTPDITIDPDKPVVNVPVIKDLTDTGDPLSEGTKPVANVINYVDPDGNPIKDPDGNPVTKKVSGNPGDPITLDLPKGFHFPNGKTPDISIDPDKPVVNIPVIKDLTDTGDPLTKQTKPVANVINYVDPDGNPVKDPDGNPVTKRVSGNPGDPISLDLPKGFHFPNGKTPDITIDPDKPVVNIPVIKDLTDTGDPLTEQVKPVANIINFV
ncbi:MucBP domain-containing protein, partial [Limosilactobacillus reuteri]|uniref:MucBP domain-containing protein n=5 Tax=Limosilactobacillus reuteri TaxID=1598 RepID=UPI001E5E38A4